MNPQATTLAGTFLLLPLLLRDGLQHGLRGVPQAVGLQAVGLQALVVVAVPPSEATPQVVAVSSEVLAVPPVGLVAVFQAEREVSRVVAAR
jgi:hypothetical protein